MTQASAVAPVQARLQPDHLEPDFLEPLLRLAGDMENARVLIVAEHGLDLICRLIRRGCLAVTMLRPGGKADAGAYDVVFVPDVSALSSSEVIIRLARRSLRPNGRLVAGVGPGRAAVTLMRRLRLNGLSAIHSTGLPGLALLRAGLRRPS